MLSRQADRPRPHTAQVDSSLRRGAIASAAPKQPRKGYLAVGLNAASLSKKPQQRASITESRTDRINRQLATADDVCKAAFDLFDSNGEGCISEAEMVRMMTRPSPSGTKMTIVQAKALFRNMDINANGSAEDGGGGGVEFREFAIRWKRDAKMLSGAAHASLAADFELSTPMFVMPFARFKEQGRIWKSTSTWRADAFRNGWLLPHEPGAGLVTVYVSHRWWHSPPGRPAGVIDWGGPDHAEGANTNLKWKMLCAAVEALIARDKLDQNRVALWIDWQSIYQDDAEAKALGIASLLKITTLCRYMLVPVDLPKLAAEARSDPLALPDYGGRAWCRRETFVFSLWAEMQPDQAPVQLYAGTSDGGTQPYLAASNETIYISYVGIIDFLQDWTCAKKVAMCVKCCERNKATIPPVCSSVLSLTGAAATAWGRGCCIPPYAADATPTNAQVPYGDRFASFVDAKFSGDCAPVPEVVALDATP